jgi:hypothetical protein
MAAPPYPAAPDRPDAATTLRLFDCLAPFFVDVPAKGATNWSKIPFADLERDGVLDPVKVEAILPAFDRYIATMADLGYNAVAIDDLAHLVVRDFYPKPLRRKLASYRCLYERLFATIAKHGLRLFAITDYQFFNPAIERYLAAHNYSEAAFFAETVRIAFAAYPMLDGVILRVGEGDGVDVEGDFKSRLTIRRPSEARALLQTVLPLFEAQDKQLIFRTWTLGAYPIGDLIWNQETYDAVFGGIESPNLVVSLKYGDTDFFRYVDVNPLFFHGRHKKIVEFQCRREYEGMGEFPSFVGWLHAGYLAALRARPCHLVGMYAIQAGGWAPFRRLAFCGDGSIWNELNTFATVKLFAGDATVEAVVTEFCRWYGIADVDRFVQLLKLSDEAIEEGLYVREFAAEAMYFRRVRVPPLVWVFWNNVTTAGLIGLLHRYLVRDKRAAVAEGHGAVEKVREMARLAGELGIGDAGLAFQRDTFAILACLREVLLGVESPETCARLAELVADYRRAYPAGYRFDDAPAGSTELRRPVVLLFQLLIRRQRQYRRSDRVLLNRYVSRFKAFVVRRQQAKLPRFVDKQGMTADVLLR